MTDQLIALLGGVEVGRVLRSRTGRLSFQYDEGWQSRADAYPLSLSMPFALVQHGHAKIDAFLWGLLPDNQKVIDPLGKPVPRLAPLCLWIDFLCRRRLCGRGPVRAP
jgi:serine/threonine-protein kinase HipA